MKLNINLLPPEVAQKESYKARLRLINQISIIGLVLMITVASSILLLRLLQSQELNQASQQLTEATDHVQSLKSREGLLLNFKNRLDKLVGYTKQPSKAVTAFDLVDSLRPANIRTVYFGVDRQSDVTFSGESTGSADLGVFFANLTDDKKTDGQISTVRSDNLSRSGDNRYKFDLAIDFK